MSDSPPVTVDLSMSMTDLESSVVVISEQDISSAGASPTKLTPASKRKRDDSMEMEQNEDLGFSESNPSSEDFIKMERESPEPRRKQPTGMTPQKESSAAEKSPTVPDVVQGVDLDNNLPETVTLLRTSDGGKVYVVGTAHFSEESQNDVSTMIQAVKPHRVVVELCGSRTDIFLCDEEAVLASAKEINIQKVVSLMKKNGAVQGLLYLTLLTMSAHVTKELGMAPGGEFRRAFREAEKLPGCVLLLGDRPINVTMARLLAGLSWWQCAKLLWSLILNKEPIKKEDVENAKKRDFLEAMLAEMGGEFPSLKEVLVTERDKYLTYSLQNAVSCSWNKPNDEPCRVVGVVGIGHVAGIQKYWGRITEHEVAQLMAVPPPTLTSRVLRASLRFALIGGAAYVVYKIVPYDRLVQMVRP